MTYEKKKIQKVSLLTGGASTTSLHLCNRQLLFRLPKCVSLSLSLSLQTYARSLTTEQGGQGRGGGGQTQAHHYTSLLAFNPHPCQRVAPCTIHRTATGVCDDASPPKPAPRPAVVPLTNTTTTTSTPTRTRPIEGTRRGRRRRRGQGSRRRGKEALVPRAARASKGLLDTERVPCITGSYGVRPQCKQGGGRVTTCWQP